MSCRIAWSLIFTTGCPKIPPKKFLIEIKITCGTPSNNFKSEQVVVEGPVMRTLYKEVTRKVLIGVVEDTEVDKEVDE